MIERLALLLPMHRPNVSFEIIQPLQHSSHLCVLNNSGLKTLRVLDVDGLDVAVELLLGILLVVTLSRDAHAKSEWNTLDTGLPDLLVQLWVEADILGSLSQDMLAHPSLQKKTIHHM